MTEPSALEERVAALEQQVAASRPKKDFWDVLSAIGGLATPLVVAGLGIYLPYRLNEAQRQRDLIAAESSLRVAKANIIPPLMDALLSNDAARRQLAVSTLLIALPTEGPELARIVAASDPSQEVKQYASASLDRRRQALLIDLFSADSQTRIEAARALIAGWREDGTVVQELIRYAEEHRDNPNGVYNTVIVLGGLSPAATMGHRDAILRFAEWAQRQGRKTKSAVEELTAKLP